MNGTTAIQIRTRQELELCDTGQPIMKSGRVGVYAGLEAIQTCSCMCENTFLFPVIVYPTDDGSIDKEVVFALDPPVPHQITGYSIIESIGEQDPRYEAYKRLFNEFSG